MGNAIFHSDDMKYFHIVTCCIDDLTTDQHAVTALALCYCSWYDVLAGAVHLHILTEVDVHLSSNIPAFSRMVPAI
jgi:hypothetical protein